MAAGGTSPPDCYMTGESWDDLVESFHDWSLATGQAEKSEVQVATLKLCIGTDAWKIFAKFAFNREEDRNKMTPVKARYRAYFEPQCNITFERHKLHAMKQGRERVDDWVTEL